MRTPHKSVRGFSSFPGVLPCARIMQRPATLWLDICQERSRAARVMSAEQGPLYDSARSETPPPPSADGGSQPRLYAGVHVLRISLRTFSSTRAEHHKRLLEQFCNFYSFYVLLRNSLGYKWQKKTEGCVSLGEKKLVVCSASVIKCFGHSHTSVWSLSFILPVTPSANVSPYFRQKSVNAFYAPKGSSGIMWNDSGNYQL